MAEWSERWDLNPQNSTFEVDTYAIPSLSDIPSFITARNWETVRFFV